MTLQQKINAILKEAGFAQDCQNDIEREYFYLGNRRLVFKIQEQPNCCGIGVVTDFHIYPSPTLTGCKALLQIAEIIAVKQQYGMMLITDIEPMMQKAANACGWKVIETFVNPKTANKIFMATKVII